MYVRHVELRHFRAFQHAEIKFPRNGLVLVAGANNAGKTALLSVFDGIAGNDGDVTSIRYAGSGEAAQVRATFDLDDAERETVLKDAPGGSALRNAGVLSSVQFVYEQWMDEGLKLREVLGSWADLGLQPLARMRPDGPSGQYTYEVIRAFQQVRGHGAQPGAAFDVASQDLRVLEPAGTQSLGANSLEGFLPSRVSLATIAALLQIWRSRFYHFRALRTGTQRSQVLASPDKLDPTGSNLAGVLHFLATDRRHLFEQARELITRVVPGIGDLHVRTGGDRMRVVFDGPTGDLNLKDLGTGVEQLLMTLVVGLIEEPPSTLLIEEPETNLNPAAQRALLGLLQQWAKDRLIIAATHSPIMLDWSPAGDRLWLVTRDHGVSTVEPVSADPLPMLNVLGVRLSDVLSADRVLVVEGASDEDILRVWFPEVLLSPRVAVLRGQGGDNARHAAQLAEWLTGADRAELRKVLYVRDHDELPPSILEKLSRSPSVYVLQRREIENYLLDPDAIAKVLASLVPSGTSAPDGTAIAVDLKSAAENLRHRIVINRMARRIAPPRSLMDNHLRQRLAKEGVDRATFINAVAERLMARDALVKQIAEAWDEAEADVESHAGDALLNIAPGEEVLSELFRQYTGSSYNKRIHGPSIAAEMIPPGELAEVLSAFMGD